MDDSQTQARMNILAIECSQPAASLCLSCGGQVVYDNSWKAERNHDSYLFPALQAALEQLGTATLDIVLVGAGPGSYGGVRVALAAAVGISTVKGARVVAIGSWGALAENGAAIVSDARRGGWTLRRPDGEIAVLSTAELLAEQASGMQLYTIETRTALEKHGITAARYELVPTARRLVTDWLSLTPEQQSSLAAKPAEPIYVRPPHITEAKRKPWEIASNHQP